MKKLYCYILILIISVFLLSGCSNEQTKGWTDNDLYGTFETTHFTSQELDLSDFDKKFVKILNATIVNITYDLQTSLTIVRVYDYGELINQVYNEQNEIIDFYLPHLSAKLYTNIPYYKQPYEIGDVISFEGFVFYSEVSENVLSTTAVYHAAFRFDVSPAIIIND